MRPGQDAPPWVLQAHCIVGPSPPTFCHRARTMGLSGRNGEEAKGSFQPLCCRSQELLPRGLDIKQEELGDLVDKEMAATSAAIETATARIEVWKRLPVS